MTISRRVGLLGGTFDPVHVAHLHIAACAMHDLELDEIRFIPAGSPPHKPGRPVTPAADRLRMLEIATAGVSGFVADPVDLSEDVPSYTADLLGRIRDQRPDDHLWFIIGGDSLSELHTWHDPERILSLARLAAADRPGWNSDVAILDSSLSGLAARVDRFRSLPIDLSATMIRSRIAAGEPVDWLVPESVLQYIREHQLYTSVQGSR